LTKPGQKKARALGVLTTVDVMA
jgi:hypothetical protein